MISYLQFCNMEYLPHTNQYSVTGHCIVTGNKHVVKIKYEEFIAFTGGNFKALISLSDDDREFIITGVTPAGHTQLAREYEESLNSEPEWDRCLRDMYDPNY